MQNTPIANRLHIAIFGRRNAGKSRLINALTNQEVALVSEVPGTTTDPVHKTMELLPLGPVVITDTAGLDDEGELGEQRMQRSLKVLRQSDLAVIVIDASRGIGPTELELRDQLKQERIPAVGFVNKADLVGKLDLAAWEAALGLSLLSGSAATGAGVPELKARLMDLGKEAVPESPLVADLVKPGQLVVLVVPIDPGTPKGRLILPQVQAIREILDNGAMAVVVKDRELARALERLDGKPDLVITDSQAFKQVAAIVPPDVPLTSFSILFARQKGDLATLVSGSRAIDALRVGDRILVSEACTHERQCDDIGRVQIPRWLRQHVGGDLQFTWTSGMGFPDAVGDFKLAVHCGGCMINRREMFRRLDALGAAGVPVVNYGVLLAKVHGVLDRALGPFPRERQVLAGSAPSPGR